MVNSRRVIVGCISCGDGGCSDCWVIGVVVLVDVGERGRGKRKKKKGKEKKLY